MFRLDATSNPFLDSILDLYEQQSRDLYERWFVARMFTTGTREVTRPYLLISLSPSQPDTYYVHAQFAKRNVRDAMAQCDPTAALPPLDLAALRPQTQRLLQPGLTGVHFAGAVHVLPAPQRPLSTLEYGIIYRASACSLSDVLLFPFCFFVCCFLVFDGCAANLKL